MKHRYGLEYDEYLQMFIDQDNRCAICNKLSGDTKGTRLHVDHCHTSGNVRKLLCSRCNMLVGALESPLREQADNYLKEYNID